MRRLEKRLMVSRFKSIRMKFDRVVPQVNTHRLAESDFRFNVTLSRRRTWRHWKARRKVLTPGEWTQNVCRRLCSRKQPPVP